jgi:phosphate starvation-inducible protein PhoH
VLGALFGQFDQNLVQIENRMGVYISARGNKAVIEGPDDAVARARDVLKGMHQRLLAGLSAQEQKDFLRLLAKFAGTTEPHDSGKPGA